jgi:hypothetical protein
MQGVSVFRNNGKTVFISIVLISIVLISASILLVHTVSGIDLEPGSEEDPLVTKSYVDNEFKTYQAQINSKINLLKSEFRKSGDDEDDKNINLLKNQLIELESQIIGLKNLVEKQEKYIKFEVVEIEAGQSIILSDSSEIILRAGKALAIAGEKGDGLADITTDSEKNNLVTGDIVPLNHLLLVSRNDNRGIKAITKIWVLVKGDYNILESNTAD